MGKKTRHMRNKIVGSYIFLKAVVIVHSKVMQALYNEEEIIVLIGGELMSESIYINWGGYQAFLGAGFETTWTFLKFIFLAFMSRINPHFFLFVFDFICRKFQQIKSKTSRTSVGLSYFWVFQAFSLHSESHPY